MSVNTIERILWEFGEEPHRVKEFLNDPDNYLSGYPLTEEEFRMLQTMDVAALDEYGVSNMLGMMSWTALYGNNPLTMFDYLQRMNHGKLPNNMQMPGPVFKLLLFAVGVRKAIIRTLNVFGFKRNMH